MFRIIIEEIKDVMKEGGFRWDVIGQEEKKGLDLTSVIKAINGIKGKEA